MLCVFKTQQKRGQPYKYALRTICDATSQSQWTATNSFELKENAWIADPNKFFMPDTVGMADPVPTVPTDETESTQPTPEESIEEILNTPIKIIIPADGEETLPEGVPDAVPVLPPNPTVEQLQTALKRIKPTCAGITASYVCGNHDAVPQYSGEVISVTSGDDLAMNSMVISVVEIDGAGNGTGIIKVGMLNNAKLGVALSGIVVAKGGCIIAGKAELNDVAISVLNDKQRENLTKAYAVFEKATDAAIENAGAVAEVYNDIAAALKAVREKAKIVIDKINSGVKPSPKELKTLETLAKLGTEAKKKELENYQKLPGADTSKYTVQLASWLKDQDQGMVCLVSLKAFPTTIPSKKGGPSVEDEMLISMECDEIGNLTKEPPKTETKIAYVVCNNMGILELGSISFKKGTKVFLKENQKYALIGVIGEKIDLNIILTNIFEKTKKLAIKETLYDWINHVKPNGDWDFKSCEAQSNTIFGLANVLRDNCIWENKNKIFTKFVWSNHIFEDASDIGNFNFGFTGRFVGNVGFTIETLNKYAGILQYSKDITGIFKGDFESFKKGVEEYKASNVPPYGDEVDDYEWSKKGMSYAQSIKICPCPKN